MKKRGFTYYLSYICLFLGLGLGAYLMFETKKEGEVVETYKEEFVIEEKPTLTSKEEVLAETISGNEAQETIIDEDTRGLGVGKLSMPSIGVSMPIIKGEFLEDGTDNMLYGAVTNKVNQEMGFRNYVLSSHIVNNKKALFSSLTDVKKGDLVYLTDGKTLFTYVIEKEFVVKPSEIHILEDIEGKATITLYTCKYINEFENGVQKTDRTVRTGVLKSSEKLTESKDKEYFGF